MGDEPTWSQQYRKAIVAGTVGLLAALTDLGVALADGSVTAQEWVHVAITFVGALVSTGGVAAVSNVYPTPELERRLVAAARHAQVGTVPPPDTGYIDGGTV